MAATICAARHADYKEKARAHGRGQVSLAQDWRKRSIPTHSEWLYPLTFDAGKGLKEA